MRERKLSDRAITFNSERDRHSPAAARWEGVCHGWALASLLLEEPGLVTLTNPDGISVSFGSSDVKALLAYFLGDILRGAMYRVGVRCDGGNASSPACLDVNAASFHVILANQLGRRGRGLVIETDSGVSVWNRPAFTYTSRVENRQRRSSPGAALGTVEEFTVTTTVGFGRRSAPAWEPQGNQPAETETYSYRLELDAGGRILGGAWLSSRRPDFVWMRDDNVFTSQAPKELKDIYLGSVGRASPRTDTQPGADDEQRLCPDGWSLLKVFENDLLGYCSQGEMVLGPFPKRMQDFCSLSGGGGECAANYWSRTLFLRVRGDATCPQGTEYDFVIETCADDDFAFGPFREWQVDECRRILQANTCETLRWNYYDAVRVGSL